MAEKEMDICLGCGGSGKCSRCGGSGHVQQNLPSPMPVISGTTRGGAPSSTRRTCSRCTGTGTCQACKGTGKASS